MTAKQDTLAIMTLFVGLVVACGGRSARTPAAATVAAQAGLPVISFQTTKDGTARLAVQIEANDAARQRGLMGVTALPADQGQLFVFQDVAPNRDVSTAFWMKDTPLPLSIAFISAAGRVLDIQDMQPESTATHASPRPYRYAVEANQGWFRRHDVVVGAIVSLSAALAAGTASATAGHGTGSP